MNSREITMILVVVLGVIIFIPALTMSIWGFGMMGHGMMPGGYGLFTAVLLLLGGALLAFALSRRATAPDPLEVLKQRLARGEVSKEQYEELKHLLQS